jgi:predicted ABC-type ATPase
LSSGKPGTQLRMRIFAGPNGSGKSSVIEYVRKQKVNGYLLDFGIYVNADDIAKALKENHFSFATYGITTTNKEFQQVSFASGLINDEFDEAKFKSCYTFSGSSLCLAPKTAGKAGINNPDERIAQILADFIRKKLLADKKRFSFETVFSHEGKLDIMKQGLDAGYKVYLYFVSTASPDINKFRVLARKKKGGHDVPPAKIESRYYRSMELLYSASQLAYQAFYFDNSEDGKESTLFAHFKKTGKINHWDKMKKKDIPAWFIKYYFKKQNNL